jgi:Uma2 family endonuclease
MELLIEEVVMERELSDYEIERNKPMPTLIHGAIQFNLGFELKTKNSNRFRFASEVLLDTKPLGSTPDLILYPLKQLDYRNDPSRREDAPLLAIEIQSASQSLDEMVNKTLVYFDFGVKSCWVVQPRIKAIIVFSSPDEYKFFHHEDILKDSTLDIEVDLQNIFE